MRIVKSFVPALLLASLFSSLGYAVSPDRIAGALSSGQTVTLRGSVHRKALPQYDQGPVDPALRLGYVTLLTVPTASQQKALKQLLAEQQDRKSANYHKWLTPEQYADRFGLSHGDVQKITEWLKAKGFTLGNVARGRNWIVFGGTASQIQSAFGTEIHRYKVDGEDHFANAKAPKIPAALSGIVSGFRGLNDFRPKPMTARNARAAFGARPDYYDLLFQPPAPPDYLAPGDIATIYDIKALYNAGFDGTGQKLAIVGQTDVYLADLNDFRGGFGLPLISGCATDGSGIIRAACTTTNFEYILNGPDPGVSLNDLTEADLDIEWSGAVARNAQIIYVNSGTANGVWDSWYYAVDHTVAPVISMSYGLCEFFDNFVLSSSGQPLADELELMKANSEGITFLNSTGDSGAAGCDAGVNSSSNNLAVGGLAVSYPASSPEVTGVGGTAVAFPAGFGTTYWGTTNGTDGGSALLYAPETAWNDDEELALAFGQNQLYWQQNFAIVATGGGASNCAKQTADNLSCAAGFPQPSWQTVTVPSQASVRFSPDVSMNGSPNFPGYIFCTPQDAWSSSSSSSSTCSPGGTAGIANALAFTDPNSGNPDPSLVGGTSASTPVFAGVVTLLNQSLGSSSLGNINPMLYSLAATPSNGAFHPVTTGDNNVYCVAGTPAGTTQDPWPTALQCPTAGIFGFSASNKDTTTGFNLVTGLGSVDADKLALAWAATVPAEFSLAPTVGNFQVAQGSSIDATVTVTLDSGFTGPVTFTCTEPAGLTDSTCTAPPAVNTSQQVSFHVTTNAPSAELRRPFDRGTRVFYAALLPGLLGILLTAGTRKRSVHGLRLLGLIMMLGFSTLWLGACGGSNSNRNPGTTKGTYTITVSGTSGTETSSNTFTLTVQ